MAPEPGTGARHHLRFALPLSIVLVIALRVAWEWRFFARFMDDDSWPLRVADRIAAGEHIYTDIGWVYGPLPVWVVGLLFRVSRTVVWDALLDTVLCLAAVGSVWFLSTRLVGRSVGGWITAWTAALGAPVGLISYELTAYTSAVAWGAATALLATANAFAWVQRGKLAALAATFVSTVMAVLSKPEFGLAGICVLAAALWLRRPSRRILIGVATCLAAAGVAAALRVDASTWFAWWRGYSGYDLIETDMVPVVVPDRVAGALGLAAGFAICLWLRTAGALIAAIGAIFAAILLVRDVTTRPGLQWLLPQVLRFTWAGVVPWLVWIGWRAGSRSGSGPLSLSPASWIATIFAITVNFRFFLFGEFCAAAAGPAAAVAWFAMRERLVPRPTRLGLVVIGVVMLASLQSEIDAISRPRGATRVDTPLGRVRVPPRTAAAIVAIRPPLDAAPDGTLFVSGAGPVWYLLSGRQNPARFDAILRGVGTTPPEVAGLLAVLRTHPPALVIVEDRFEPTPEYSHDHMWAVLGTRYTPLASTSRWQLFVADSAPFRSQEPMSARQAADLDGAFQDSRGIR